MFAPAALLTGTASTARADSCPDTEVIFARGTDEWPPLGGVGNGFVGALRAKAAGSVSSYGVNYPASKDYSKAADGANDASQHIQNMVNTCPATKLVLGGYSQGASVVDILTGGPPSYDTFTNRLRPEDISHITAVVVFGNPEQKYGHPLVSNPVYGSRTIELCADGDPVCSDGGNYLAHLSYWPAMTDQAADFAAARL